MLWEFLRALYHAFLGLGRPRTLPDPPLLGRRDFAGRSHPRAIAHLFGIDTLNALGINRDELLGRIELGDYDDGENIHHLSADNATALVIILYRRRLSVDVALIEVRHGALLANHPWQAYLDDLDGLIADLRANPRGITYPFQLTWERPALRT